MAKIPTFWSFSTQNHTKIVRENSTEITQKWFQEQDGKVKKQIIIKLYGGRLNDVNKPNIKGIV